MSAILMGLGATLTSDLWALFLKRAFRMAPPGLCLVGRWLRYMPEGTFRHANIGSAPPKSAECTTGWIAHYGIGTLFAIAFVALAGSSWLEHPALVPAVIFGMGTVLAPFLIMQPSFGLGLAASKTADPRQARMRSLLNHFVFGMGLYLFGLLASCFLW
jgi:hypothetical protein